jgi:RimJ/RimL family protein N-acetyltransferase
MFPLTENIILENERVLLRPLQQEDYQLLLPFALKEPELWKFSLVSAAGETGMKNYIETALAERAKGTEYPFIVFDKLTGKYAGSTRFYDIQITHGTTQLGYTWYGKEFQRTGLNRHCKWLLLTFAFETWKAERVEFRADANNERSIQAMKAIGCIEEGILRSHTLTDRGTRRSSIVLSILKEEWVQTVKEKLRSKI